MRQSPILIRLTQIGGKEFPDYKHSLLQISVVLKQTRFVVAQFIAHCVSPDEKGQVRYTMKVDPSINKISLLWSETFQLIERQGLSSSECQIKSRKIIKHLEHIIEPILRTSNFGFLVFIF